MLSFSAGRQNITNIIKDTEERCSDKTPEEVGVQIVNRLFYDCGTGRVLCYMYIYCMYRYLHLLSAMHVIVDILAKNKRGDVIGSRQLYH